MRVASRIFFLIGLALDECDLAGHINASVMRFVA
jgi:hypothetical protein